MSRDPIDRISPAAALAAHQLPIDPPADPPHVESQYSKPSGTNGPLAGLNRREATARADSPSRVPTVTNRPASPLALTLDALAALAPEDVDVRAGRKLPDLIMAALAPQAQRLAVSGYTGPAPRNSRDIAAALENGEMLIPENIDISPIRSWLGEVDLARLNDWRRYLDEPSPDTQLIRDLWIAHAIGLVPLDLAPAGHFNNPIAIHQIVAAEGKRRGVRVARSQLSWPDRLAIRYWSTKGQPDRNLPPKEAYLKFVQTLCDNGLIGSTSLGPIFAAVDPAVGKARKWTRMPLQLDEAIRYREIVSSLVARCEAGDEQALQYRGDGGQIQLARELRKRNDISTGNLGFLYTALDREWLKALEWTKNDQSIDDALAFRRAVEDIVTSLASNAPAAPDYHGDDGQLRLVKMLHEAGRITSTNLSTLHSSLDRDWLEKLGWTKILVSTDEAMRYRAAVAALVGRLKTDADQTEPYLGDAGQIRFVQELLKSKVIGSSSLLALHSALDRTWLSALAWSRLDLRLDEAIACREAVQGLVERCAQRDPQALAFRGDGGQVQFMQRLYDEKRVSSSLLARIASVLDESWRSALGWSIINLSIAEASAYRRAVEDLANRYKAGDATAMEYAGNAGQLRLVETLKSQGVISAANLSQLNSALDNAWTVTLGWSRIEMSLDGAIAYRALVSKLAAAAASGDREARSYRGDSGQLRLALELREKKALPSINLRALNSALNKEWLAALEWSPMRLSLDTAVTYRQAVADLVARIEAADMDSRRYLGDEGQLRFVADLHDSQSIATTHLGDLHSSLDRAWADALGWSFIGLTLADANEWRSAVARLALRCAEGKRDALKFKGNGGQIRFAQQLRAEGRIASADLAALRTALHPDWLMSLGWTIVKVPLAEVNGWRAAVEALVGKLRSTRVQDRAYASVYKGRAGQLRFIAEMQGAGRIASTSPDGLFSALDGDWTTVLDWKMIGIRLDVALRYREQVAALVERLRSGDSDAAQYIGTAGQIRWIRTLTERGTIGQSAPADLISALESSWCETLAWSTIAVPCDDALAYRNAVEDLVDRCANGDAEALSFQGPGGQIRFVKRLCDTGRIQPRRPGQLSSALDSEWRAALSWPELDIDLDIALAFREAVQELVRRVDAGDDAALRYRDNGGQLLFLNHLRNERVIGSANPRQLWSTVEPEWAEALGWKRLYRKRSAVESERRRLATGWRNNPGMLDLSSLLAIAPEDVDAQNGALPRLIFSALAVQRARFSHHRPIEARPLAEIARCLQNRIPLIPADIYAPRISTWFGEVDIGRLNDVTNYLETRRPTAEMVKDLWVAHALGVVPLHLTRASSMNMPRELDFVMVTALRQSGRKVARMRVSWSDQFALDYWMSVEQWTEDDKSRDGEIRFLTRLYDAGRISTADLAQLHTAIGPEWVQRLTWPRIALPGDQAHLVREAVAELAARCTAGDPDAMSYIGDAGQIRFIQGLRREGKLTAGYLAPLYLALDEAWRETLQWSWMNMSVDDAGRLREAVESLAERVKTGDPHARAYRGIEGQLRFIETLRDSGKLTATNLAQTSSALDSDWKATLGWPSLNLPLDQAFAYRAAVKALIADIREGDDKSVQYKGNAGQILFVSQLRDEHKLSSFRLVQLHRVLEKEWTEMLEWTGIELPLDEALRYRACVMDLARQFAAGVEEARQYRGNTGQIRFIRKLLADGTITSVTPSSLATAIDTEWMATLGWSAVDVSLEDASRYQREVAALVERCAREKNVPPEYLGNAGQVRFIEEMIQRGKIASTGPSELYSALESRWTDVLVWNRIELSLTETQAVRGEIEALVQRCALGNGDALGFMGNEGQLRFITQLRASGTLKSIQPASFYSVVEATWASTLGWTRIGSSLGTTTRYRAAVQALFEQLERADEGALSYTGNDGQLRFVAELIEDGSITGWLGDLYSALDRAWTNRLGWRKIPLSLEQATAYRNAVRALVERVEQGDAPAIQYIGNAGQIRFVSELRDTGRIKTTQLPHLSVVLDEAPRSVLNWSTIQLSLPEAIAFRAAVEALIERRTALGPEAIENYTGLAGQLRFADEQRNNGQLPGSRDFSSLVSALEPEWIDALGWRAIPLKPNDVLRYRGLVGELVSMLVASHPEARNYRHMAGQVRFVAKLVRSKEIGSQNLPALFDSLDPEPITALRWNRPNITLSLASAQLRAITAQVDGRHEGPHGLEVDGRPYVAAVDEQGVVIDWLSSNGLPRRLQRFTGTVVGYRTGDGETPSITLRLRPPLGYAVYSFASYVSTANAPVDIAFKNGIPTSFRIRDDSGRTRTLAANNVLLLQQHASGYHLVQDKELTDDIEVIDAGPSTEEIAEQQIIAQSVQTLLLEHFGETEARRVLQVFATWDELTQDEGLDEHDAYAEIQQRFGIDRETVARFKAELASLLVAAELHE